MPTIIHYMSEKSNQVAGLPEKHGDQDCWFNAKEKEWLYTSTLSGQC